MVVLILTIVVWVVVRETDEVTPTGVMKDVVKVTTLSMNVTNHLNHGERESKREQVMMECKERSGIIVHCI